MPQQSLSQVRVQDPILTQFAHGYRHPMRVGNYLYPAVPVTISGGQVLEFGRESFQRINARRAPGANTKRIEFGYKGDKYALTQDALESVVPREHLRDAQVMPGIDLGRQRTTALMNTITLQLEIEQAELARDVSKYGANHKITLSGTDQWSDPSANPIVQMDEYKEAIRADIGLYPNVAIAGPSAYNTTKNNPYVVERMKYREDQPETVTMQMLATLFELRYFMKGPAMYLDESGASVDCWGDDIVLAYVPPEILDNPNQTLTYAPNGGLITFETPSYGYTYTMEGHPMIEEAYYSNECKGWVYGCTYERAPVNTSNQNIAGFLIKDVTG